ncbi:hypothetical protein [Pantoea agglomerans]|uniref:Uncharacterized protein n=1 Tax=Enterobacter agglomerans TaxID=549 RepID=A0ACC5PSU4_ENTAG|nr:hypothetical protein [Pantoea agglomerans]MBD8127978.1 hypothetical protein [Pantoea agglomerans]MBD8155742.1 hypothetical protein [Pantoea agglomerans]MBD8244896.1 hypothetical protein [Pantoea agglomerans]
MRVITFDGYDSIDAVNEPAESIFIECGTVRSSNVVSFENKKKDKEILEAFFEIVNNEIIFD